VTPPPPIAEPALEAGGSAQNARTLFRAGADSGAHFDGPPVDVHGGAAGGAVLLAELLCAEGYI